MSEVHSSAPRRTYGFRFNLTDAVILIISVAASAWLLTSHNPFWWLIPFVVMHFFLFCNIFRVRRAFELIWAAIFICLNMWCALRANWNLAIVCAIQLPATICVLAAEIPSRRYHGIFARQWNSSLDDYLSFKIP